MSEKTTKSPLEAQLEALLKQAEDSKDELQKQNLRRILVATANTVTNIADTIGKATESTSKMVHYAGILGVSSLKASAMQQAQELAIELLKNQAKFDVDIAQLGYGSDVANKALEVFTVEHI